MSSSAGSKMSKQRDEERQIMEVLVSADPEFAGEAIASWRVTGKGCDPPDVVCQMASGRVVGVEIAQWANESEMHLAKSRQGREDRIVEALTHGYEFTVFFRPTDRALKPCDYAEFLKAFSSMVTESVSRWDRTAALPVHSPKLGQFPPLSEYLEWIVLSPIEPDTNWLLPAGHMSWYDNGAMGKPLLCLFEAKKEKCQEPKLKTPCDSLFLLIAYDQAVGCCSPIQPQFETVCTFVERVAQQFSADPGPFDGALLLIPGEPVPTIHRLL
jgi:hypothetical protein